MVGRPVTSRVGTSEEKVSSATTGSLVGSISTLGDSLPLGATERLGAPERLGAIERLGAVERLGATDSHSGSILSLAVSFVAFII